MVWTIYSAIPVAVTAAAVFFLPLQTLWCFSVKVVVWSTVSTKFAPVKCILLWHLLLAEITATGPRTTRQREKDLLYRFCMFVYIYVKPLCVHACNQVLLAISLWAVASVVANAILVAGASPLSSRHKSHAQAKANNLNHNFTPENIITQYSPRQFICLEYMYTYIYCFWNTWLPLCRHHVHIDARSRTRPWGAQTLLQCVSVATPRIAGLHVLHWFSGDSVDCDDCHWSLVRGVWRPRWVEPYTYLCVELLTVSQVDMVHSFRNG